jgi:putative transposase
MPRHPRQQSETGIYHIIMRGINKQTIFEDSKDKERFFDTLKRYKTVSNYEVYGYCFMDNHVHILIKEITEPISLIVKRISGSYVYWFNRKYERWGHLFQERFKSEAVENDAYFLTVLRYIHQNPVKAGITKSVSEFRWSSFHEYVGEPVLTDVDFALNMFSPDNEKALELFKIFMNETNNDRCLDYEERVSVSDSEIKAILLQKNIQNINQLLQLNKQERNKIIKDLKSIEGVSIRQLSRLTGISKSVIARI